MAHERVLILAHSEEVSFLVCLLYGATAVGADSALNLRIGKERFARHTVPTFIFALVYVALVIELFKNLLNGLDVLLVRCADELVVA